MATPDALPALAATPLISVMAVLAGAALGGLFYGGLWWTVRRTARFRHPGSSLLGSMLLRMAVTVGGFYIVAGGDWARLLLCLVGFLVARVAVTWLTRLPRAANGRPSVANGARRAP